MKRAQRLFDCVTMDMSQMICCKSDRCALWTFTQASNDMSYVPAVNALTGSRLAARRHSDNRAGLYLECSALKKTGCHVCSQSGARQQRTAHQDTSWRRDP